MGCTADDVMKEDYKCIFPVIVLFIDGSFLRIDKPEQLPVGFLFKIIHTNITLLEFDLWRSEYQRGRGDYK